MILARSIDYTSLPTHFAENSGFAIPTSATKLPNYTVPSGGKYLILATLSVNTPSANDTVYLPIFHNGSQVVAGYATVPAGCYGNVSMQRIIEASAGDTVTAGARAITALAASDNNSLRMSIIRVG